MRNVEFDDNEIRAMKELLFAENVCSAGCIYDEMRNSKKDCDECDYKKAIWSLIDKFEELK